MLNTQPHLQACDDFYEALIAAHHGLTAAESHAMNARLVLLLANHIGEHETLLDALRLAGGAQAPSVLRETQAERQAMTPVAPAHAGA